MEHFTMDEIMEAVAVSVDHSVASPKVLIDRQQFLFYLTKNQKGSNGQTEAKSSKAVETVPHKQNSSR